MNPRAVLVIAILLGLVTSGLVYGYLSGLGVSNAEAEPLVEVVVAAETLTPRTVIRPGAIRIARVPLSALHSQAVISPVEAEGRVVRETIVAGEQVIRTRLYGEGEQPGLTFAIPRGKRAVTVAVNEVIGVAGFIKPGDEVDVLATFDSSVAGTDMTTTVLQGVEVLAIAQDLESNSEAAKVTTTVTLAVTLAEAERLTLAEERGSLRLALRPAPFADDEFVTAVTPADVLGRSPAGTGGSRPPLEGQGAPVGSASRAQVPASPPKEHQVEVIRGTTRERFSLPSL